MMSAWGTEASPHTVPVEVNYASSWRVVHLAVVVLRHRRKANSWLKASSSYPLPLRGYRNWWWCWLFLGRLCCLSGCTRLPSRGSGSGAGGRRSRGGSTRTGVRKRFSTATGGVEPQALPRSPRVRALAVALPVASILAALGCSIPLPIGKQTTGEPTRLSVPTAWWPEGPLDKLFLPGLCLYSQDLLCHGGTCDREGRLERENRLPLTGRICPHKLHRMPFRGSVPRHLVGSTMAKDGKACATSFPVFGCFVR